MKRIIFTLSSYLLVSKVVASSSLCLYNVQSKEMSVSLNIGNNIVTQKIIPSLSSYCDDTLGNKDVVTVKITSPVEATLTINQKDSNNKATINAVKLNDELSYNLTSGNYTNTYTFYNPKNPQVISTNNWMKQISDDKQLYKIIMPGSHDAGMSVADHCTVFVSSAWAQTQNLNILEQARAGSRYFDVRPDYDYNQLTTYHRTAGFGCNGQPFEEVLDDAVKFLKENPSETLILKISHTRDDVGHKAKDIMPKVISLYTSAKYEPYVYTSTKSNYNIADDKLGSVRGKIVGVFDVEYASYINPEKGIFSYSDSTGVQHTAKVSLLSLKNGESSGVLGLSVFDQYTNTTNYNHMSTDQASKLANFAALGNPYLFLLSWTLTGEAGKADVIQLSNLANGHLPGFLHDLCSSKRDIYNVPNVVYTDNVNPWLSQSIISSSLHQINGDHR